MTFKFVDLCAGIGGMRMAARNNGGVCVFSSEINKDAAETYLSNFGEVPHGDFTLIEAETIPGHDLIMAGIPCQSFSICGHKRGFADARGTLFFDVARIARHHRTKCLIIENVKHFSKHDGGDTLATVVSVLEDIGYKVSVSVLNAKDFGMAQSRERTIIVASLGGIFDFTRVGKVKPKTIADILRGEHEILDPSGYTLLSDDQVRRQESGLLFCGYRNKNIRKVGVKQDSMHLSRAHKQPNRIYRSDGTHPTLAAGETSGRYWVGHDGGVIKLNLAEAYALQGFPNDFKINERMTAAYRQIGNSVPVPMIEEIVRQALAQGMV